MNGRDRRIDWTVVAPLALGLVFGLVSLVLAVLDALSVDAVTPF